MREVNPAAIYLFGSRARGEATRYSDVDLLIVSREPFDCQHSRHEVLGRLWRLAAKHRLPADILLYIEEWRTTAGHVIARALHEGRPLYAAA